MNRAASFPFALIGPTVLLLSACDRKEADESPTWNQDVAPIIAEHCGSCHTAGGIAPFALDDYAIARGMGDQIVAAIEDGSMPPWYAVETDECDPMLPFKDDLRLDTDELDTLRAWVNGEAPEGDASAPASLPEADQLYIGEPDLELPFSERVSISGDTDQFICFVLDPGNETQKWVTQIQLVPDNQTIDHHALIFQDVYGELADAEAPFDCFNTPSVDGFLMHTWTPGAVAMTTPEGAAMPLFAGSRLVVQMHYHPSPSGVEFDQSSVQLVWQDEEPEWAAAQALVGNDDELEDDGTGLQPGPNDPDGEAVFYIPAGAKDHTETILYTQTFPLDLPIFSVGTHMHYVGTDMKVDYIPNETGEEDCMIQTPWDFNWQRTYAFDVPIDELPVMGPGDSLRMRCTYDNSTDNPAVMRALEEQGLSEPQDVTLGEQTLDEMCLGLYGILIPPALVGELF